MPSNQFFVGPDDEPDKYRLRRRIGSGGEAELWEADVALAGDRERVVVKILRHHHMPDVSSWHDRWAEQVELLRLIQHPSVVSVHCHFQGAVMHLAGAADNSDRTLYMVMNWVDGQDLHSWLPAHWGPEHWGDVLRCLGQIADVLDWLHAGQATSTKRPVVHGDVSPGNIVVDPFGQPVLVDFGLFRVAARHTTAFAAGTPGYCAPEVLRGGSYSPAADRYSFGALTYYFLTGQHPPTERVGVEAGLAAAPLLSQRPAAVRDLLAAFNDSPDARPTCGKLIRGLRLHSSTVAPGSLPLPPPKPSAPPTNTQQPLTGIGAGDQPRRSRVRPALVAVGTLVAAAAAFSMVTAWWPNASPQRDKKSTSGHNPTASASSPETGKTAKPPEPTSRFLSALTPADGSTELEPASFRMTGRDYPNSLSTGCGLSDGVSITDYPLNSKYQRFTATLGITTDPEDGDAVGTFRLRADDKLLDSWTATRNRTAKVDIDITGVERLTLESVDLIGDPLYCKVKTFVWGDPKLFTKP